MLAALALAASAGCTFAPRDFFQNKDLAPLVRARSLGMGRELPEPVAVPTLIDKLNDPDAVVRMTAHEELKRRSGQDFGFAPYADPADQGPAIEAWKSWWQGRQVKIASTPRADPSVMPAGYPPPRTTARRGLFGRRQRPATTPGRFSRSRFRR
jgi:hypothetical protein